MGRVDIGRNSLLPESLNKLRYLKNALIKHN